ncbi:MULTISPECIES: diaminopimelate epimerase [Psychrobacter]|jgi:diaminopimelate epimerase|uniref:Diaminopimelate epimerase n=2 Tax=Psychrobacter TaxID=497 RepID=A0A6N7C1D0_9GAMM|nr:MULTISPECIES: diaminopimelate epimerase [Psychrobacter]KAF0569725.1 Diaminopimelate epimerase [Psychrobacter nivimaris]KRG35863.1 diaminopimelate epimerase [Psychrobacter sp. P11G3]MCG3857811.1 diaminopimelate epimerase [Psychrobacter sp. Ps2]MDN3440415.1 diaminopimelate epimerase [Psychrobacter sp. APC 3279]NYR08808.1 diaminopimelate epimerase [Psychrobacter sp. BI730]
MLIEFTKMHGLGNDFMVIDLVTQRLDLTKDLVQLLGDRHLGIGFDQLLVVEPPMRPDVDFSYRIFNTDGTEVEQCGNGARCFARFVQARKLSFKQRLRVETASGIISLTTDRYGWVDVDMGKPKFEPDEIPFSPRATTKIQNTYHLDVNGTPVQLYVANMGNPHAVIKVDDVLDAEVETLGKAIESHPAFPDRVNVGFMQVMNQRHIRLRVYERGVGETQACGTGACAAVAVGIREGWLDEGEEVRAQLYGGSMIIKWQPGYSVTMTGPTAFVYEGVFSPDGLMAQAGLKPNAEG